MKAPKKPSKPLKNQGPPAPYHWSQNYVLAYDNNGKVFPWESWDRDKQIENGDPIYETLYTEHALSLKDWNQINNIIQTIVKRDSAIDIRLEPSDYDKCWYLTLQVPKSKELHKQELEIYNKRFEFYELQLKNYHEDLLKWEQFKRNKMRQKLLDDLRKLEEV